MGLRKTPPAPLIPQPVAPVPWSPYSEFPPLYSLIILGNIISLFFIFSSSLSLISILPSVTKHLVFLLFMLISNSLSRSSVCSSSKWCAGYILAFSCVPYLSLCYVLCWISSVMKIFSMSRILDHHCFSSLLKQIFSFSLSAKTCMQALRIILSNHQCLSKR